MSIKTVQVPVCDVDGSPTGDSISVIDAEAFKKHFKCNDDDPTKLEPVVNPTLTCEDVQACVTETVTTLVENPDGSFTFTAGDGSTVVIPAPVPEVVTTLVDNGDNTFTYTNEALAPVTLSYAHDLELAADGSTINLVRPDGTIDSFNLCPVVENCETDLVVTTNGSFTGVAQSGTSDHSVDIVTLSVDANNLITEGADGGLFLDCDAISACTIAATIQTADTDCINFNGDGSVANPLNATPIISTAVGNIIECTPAGLFAGANSAPFNITGTDASTVTEAVNDGDTITFTEGDVAEPTVTATDTVVIPDHRAESGRVANGPTSNDTALIIANAGIAFGTSLRTIPNFLTVTNPSATRPMLIDWTAIGRASRVEFRYGSTNSGVEVNLFWQITNNLTADISRWGQQHSTSSVNTNSVSCVASSWSGRGVTEIPAGATMTFQADLIVVAISPTVDATTLGLVLTNSPEMVYSAHVI